MESAFTKLERKHCDKNKYNRYDTLPEAKADCLLDVKCHAVYAKHACDGGPEGIYLCRRGATYEVSSKSSCIYEKNGNLWYIGDKRGLRSNPYSLWSTDNVLILNTLIF